MRVGSHSLGEFPLTSFASNAAQLVGRLQIEPKLPQRTKAALAAAKTRGQAHGNPRLSERGPRHRWCCVLSRGTRAVPANSFIERSSV
jgi:hypothetical protein